MSSRTGPERFDELIAGVLPALVGEATGAGGRLYQGAGGRLYQIVMARVELPLLRHALDLCGGNQLKAAKLLGINRNTLRKRLRRLGLAPVPSQDGAPRSA